MEESLRSFRGNLAMRPSTASDTTGTTQPVPAETTDHAERIARYMELELTPKMLESIWKDIWKRIWSHTIPSGRVVDIVFDEQSNSYFSYRPKIPNLLHVCRASREIGLTIYTLCFATADRPAAIPFDFERDCLFFDDYLGFPGPDAIQPAEPTMVEVPLASIPVIKMTCELEMIRLMGPMSRYEAGNIRRIALRSSFISLYTEEDSRQAFYVLFNTFTSLEYIVFAVEEPNPFTPGEILFCELQEKDWCCFNCVLYYHMTLPPLVRSIKRDCKQSQGDFLPVEMEIRVRGVVRGGVKSPIESHHYHVGREQLPDATHIDDDAEYMQRFTCGGSTRFAAGGRRERADSDSADSEEIERWERDEMDQEIEDLLTDEKIFGPMYENFGVDCQDFYDAVYGAADLTGEAPREAAKADKNKKNKKKKKENKQAQNGRVDDEETK